MKKLVNILAISIIAFSCASCGGSSSNGSPIVIGSPSSSTVTIPLDPSSITFVSASPKTVALKGMGGAGTQETSTITFKVIDLAGNPLANQVVDFALNTSVGGITLIASSGTTTSSGTVSTIIQSGIIATSVKVTATVRGTSPVLSAQSDQLVISTGIPAQDGFSISIANLSPESWNLDGITTAVTARLSDHFHNPVPDGTTVYFTTSGGSIQPSCTTTSGACSVNWTSQNPRPFSPNASQDGRAVILAYAIGEEAFVDLNANGVADAGEFTDTTGAFRDDNENGTWDAATEPPIPFFNATGYDAADGKYNGVLQGAAYTTAPKSKHVFSNSAIVMATSAAQITNSCASPIPVALGGSRACTITINDLNGNTMPSGTTVAFSFTAGAAGISMISSSYTFPNSSSNTGVGLGISFTDDGTAPVGTGVLTVTVTSPSGVVTKQTYSVN